MSPLNKTSAAILGLAAIASALPTAQWTECQTGTWFYRCSNGYVGCYNFDPCNLPSIGADTSSTTSTTTADVYTPPAYTATDVPVCTAAAATTTDSTTTSTTTTTSATTTTAASTVPAACPSGKIFRPTMWNIVPSQPDLAQPSVSHIEVKLNGSEPELQQVAVFKGIPAGATECNLNWAQGAPEERNFVVNKSGLVSTAQLTGFPAPGLPITATSVALFEDPTSRSTSADFTTWDQPIYDAQDHLVRSVNCAETIYIKTKLNPLNLDGRVFMEQDDKNGWFIEYSC